ncbi:hypothetical protein [Actinoplanes campanulatus]|uniref:hypothetical protein n=1 Tax=Actinoplanes campanulatus TaxID=113559 RepID=UPI001952BDD3|nr:hypothetical protein [Actinoplanes capillaceus]
MPTDLVAGRSAGDRGVLVGLTWSPAGQPTTVRILVGAVAAPSTSSGGRPRRGRSFGAHDFS